MPRHIAYRRVSTSTGVQSTERQLWDCGIDFDVEFEDHQTGSSAIKRTQFLQMLGEVKQFDTIHIQSNDRCFRNTKEMLGFVEAMMDKEITVKFHSENLEFNAHGDPYQVATAKLLLTNLAAVSEFFLASLKASIKQGMAASKAKGTKIGAASPNYGKVSK